MFGIAIALAPTKMMNKMRAEMLSFFFVNLIFFEKYDIIILQKRKGEIKCPQYTQSKFLTMKKFM